MSARLFAFAGTPSIFKGGFEFPPSWLNFAANTSAILKKPELDDFHLASLRGCDQKKAKSY